jgi:hypothetical protein
MLKEAGTKNHPLLVHTRITTSHMLTMTAVVRSFLLLKDLHLYNTHLTLLLATMTMLLLCRIHIRVKASTPLSRMATMLMEYGHKKRKKFIKDPVQDATLHYRSMLVEIYIQNRPKIYHPSASTTIRTTCGMLSQGRTQMTTKQFHLKLHIVNTLATTKSAALRLTPT